jgi:AAA+ ATPase superfamily predicted ATPase
MKTDGQATLLTEKVTFFEHLLENLSENNFSGKHLDEARNALAIAISTACHFDPPYEGSQLDALFPQIEKATIGQRAAAILLIRSLGVDGLLPIDTPESRASRTIPILVEQFVPDIAKYCKVTDKKQNYEKIKLLRDFHGFVSENFGAMSNLPTDLTEISNLKTEILRNFSNKLFQAYLQPFNFEAIKAKIESIVDQIDKLIHCTDARFKSFFDQIVEDIAELDGICETSHSFFTKKKIQPFISTVKSALQELQESASDRFQCEIKTIRNTLRAAEKRYPLHEPNRYITFKIPMVNLGPGVAIDVVAEIDCGEKNPAIILENLEQRLGDIPPGEFALLIPACIVERSTSVRMTVQLEWRQLFGEKVSHIFDVEVEGQDPSINWTELEDLEPYSLEVAEGDTFVGRVEKVKSIGNKLLKTPMSSTYITGQKRIGKTSLAHAALEYTQQTFGKSDFHYLYLEYGEFCAASPQGTVKSLGDNIFDFLHQFLPLEFQTARPDFSESLSHLNNITKLLSTHTPDKRFVIVLDEFDEIHPEMYRLGALAETFFANLRTLASKKNLAFILVGGEKMPFIIAAQGDQLNKFVREPLDYFSRSTEWEEYCKLVTNPVSAHLTWDDAAIAELFNLTNGHPYYTNLLCSKIVSIAVRERDAEIISSDVRHALNQLVSELDTNAFAHMWKDGINAEREAAEVTELKRLRILVAIGRAFRNNDRSIENIVKTVGRVRLKEHEAMPLLEDFFRRNIFQEKKGDIHCSVLLFEKWLMEIGVTGLIASTLADDLEVELKKAEDSAFVLSREIQELAESWPLYRAQKIGPESIRAWLEQVPGFQNQRLLFKMLQKLRFISSIEIEKTLETAHNKFILPVVGALQIERRTEKRRDVWITYLGGPGKSGAQYARMYAKANSISTECIIEPETLERRLRNSGADFIKPKAVVVVDDVVGSGKTLGDGAISLAKQCGALLTNMSIPVHAIIMISTEEGEKGAVADINLIKLLPMKVHICEYVSNECFAFPTENLGPWASEEERDTAKALCIRLGTGLYKDPLGFKGQGLLLVLPDTCPNNSLPILHRTKPGSPNWKALFHRPVT